MTKAFLAIVVAALAGATSAGAIDLTGTWNGTYSCQQWDGAASKIKITESVLRIAQTGATLSASIDDGSGGTYNGATVDSTAKPTEQGETVLNACGTDSIPLVGGTSELMRLKAKVDPEKGTGALTGVSYFETPTFLLTCKLKYKRVETTIPTFKTCA